MMSSAMPAYVYEVPQRKNHRVFVRSVVRFSLYVTLAILSQVAELLAGGGQPLPNSALHWPKSSKYDTALPLSPLQSGGMEERTTYTSYERATRTSVVIRF
jgi:hypothetical protein